MTLLRPGPMTNVVARVVLGAGVLVTSLGVVVGFVVAQGSTWSTRVGHTADQPIPFSHQHHVTGLGLDCQYCHTSVDREASAGMPTSDTCMNCHAQLYTRAHMLEPLRESWRTGRPLSWRRVHDLPDFVYFRHSPHVQAGVTCNRCHGDVGSMPLIAKAEPLTMAWCLDCHRHPERVARAQQPAPGHPRRVDADQAALLTDCTACHR